MKNTALEVATMTILKLFPTDQVERSLDKKESAYLVKDFGLSKADIITLGMTIEQYYQDELETMIHLPDEDIQAWETVGDIIKTIDKYVTIPQALTAEALITNNIEERLNKEKAVKVTISFSNAWGKEVHKGSLNEMKGHIPDFLFDMIIMRYANYPFDYMNDTTIAVTEGYKTVKVELSQIHSK